MSLRGDAAVHAIAGRWQLLATCLLLLCVLAGCKKDPATEAIKTDANGYVCLKCGAKFYTSRNTFLEAKCPKCQEYMLEDVVGYLCTNDNHITLRPRLRGPEGESVCELCRAHLDTALIMPRETNLVAWGAIKVQGQPRP
jgi:DNA-directed RNA polymerase subunit RPC12/RpoP